MPLDVPLQFFPIVHQNQCVSLRVNRHDGGGGAKGGRWRVGCCHGNKEFQWWVSMVIVAKFWEVWNALFKIHNNCAAAKDVLRGRKEWAVCVFMETRLVWVRGRRSGGLRTDRLPEWCYLAVIMTATPPAQNALTPLGPIYTSIASSTG